jgi:hypothetical protein
MPPPSCGTRHPSANTPSRYCAHGCGDIAVAVRAVVARSCTSVTTTIPTIVSSGVGNYQSRTRKADSSQIGGSVPKKSSRAHRMAVVLANPRNPNRVTEPA